MFVGCVCGVYVRSVLDVCCVLMSVLRVCWMYVVCVGRALGVSYVLSVHCVCVEWVLGVCMGSSCCFIVA